MFKPALLASDWFRNKPAGNEIGEGDYKMFWRQEDRTRSDALVTVGSHFVTPPETIVQRKGKDR